MVENCEVTWAGPGWNKMMMVVIVKMTVMTVFLSYSWVCTLFGENDYIIIAMVMIFMTIIMMSLNQVGRAGGATVNATR